MSNLHPLKWTQRDLNPLAELELTAYSALHQYEITEPKQGKFELKKTRLSRPDKKSEFLPYFDTVTEAQDWAWAHYQRSMQPYVNADSITDIANWFKAAKPEPTIDDLCVQIGCFLEEVAELLQGLGMTDLTNYSVCVISDMADSFKNKEPDCLNRVGCLSHEQRIEIVDACCDINVTSVGVMQLLGGVDVLGAQREVIRSNNSKMVKGKFQYDENSKIMKPESYSKPDLTPFVSNMQNLHKGE